MTTCCRRGRVSSSMGMADHRCCRGESRRLRHRIKMHHVLSVVMMVVVVVLALSSGVVEAVTDPRDIEALKQVSTDPPFLLL